MPRKRVRKLVSYSTSEESSYSSSDSGYSTPRPSTVSLTTPDVRETKKQRKSKTRFLGKKLKLANPLMSVNEFDLQLLTVPPVLINAFTEALDSGNLLTVKKILFSDPAVWRDESALMSICMHAKVDSILNLVSALSTERVQISCGSSFTPLHALCMNKHLRRADSVEFVLSLNRDWVLSTMEEFGSIAPIHLLILSDPSSISDEQLVTMFSLLSPSFPLKTFSENLNCLELCAVLSGDSGRVVRALILARCDPYCIDETTGQSFLHSVCAQGKSDLVKSLVDTVSDDNVFAYTDRSGVSALHVAAAGSLLEHAECIELVASRIPPERLAAVLKDKRGWPPLIYALCSKSIPTVNACIKMDKETVCPTWGPYPQFTACLHLVEAQSNRMEKLNASDDDNQLITIFKFLTRVSDCTDAINEFLKGKLGRTWNDSLDLFFDPDSLCPVSVENKLDYIHERALRHTRDAGVKSTIFIDSEDDVSRIVPKYVQGQLLGLRGDGLWEFFDRACKNFKSSFETGLIIGFILLDKQAIGDVKICREVVGSVFTNDQVCRGLFTVVHPEWMKLTLTDLESIFCDKV